MSRSVSFHLCGGLYTDPGLDQQYNALLDLASVAVSGRNMYSVSWEGPPPTQLVAWGQLTALDVLNSAFAMTSESLAE